MWRHHEFDVHYSHCFLKLWHLGCSSDGWGYCHKAFTCWILWRSKVMAIWASVTLRANYSVYDLEVTFLVTSPQVALSSIFHTHDRLKFHRRTLKWPSIHQWTLHFTGKLGTYLWDCNPDHVKMLSIMNKQEDKWMVLSILISVRYISLVVVFYDSRNLE